MARLKIKEKTIKALFAKSGNQCAFPECEEKLIDEKNLCIGELCHIEATNGKGPRFNSNSNDEYRRSYENLILLCPTHHRKIDKSNFSKEDLKTIKTNHEKEFEHSNFRINDETLTKFMNEMNHYWRDIERVNQNWLSEYSLAIDIEVKRDYFKLINELYESISSIEDSFQLLHESDKKIWGEIKEYLKKNGVSRELLKNLQCSDNPFISRNWEIHNLKVNNSLEKLRVDLIYIEIKALEEFLKHNPSHSEFRLRLKDKKETLKKIAQTCSYAD